MAPVINGRNFYNNMFNTGVMKKLIPHTPTDMAATLALISTTTKDAVNCYYYTTQSLHNEKIPEEKRKFVAGLDLSNGILNVVVQFALGSAMNTVSSKLFEKWFGKSFNEEAGKKLHKVLEKTKKYNYTEKQVIDSLAKNKKYASAGFKVIAVLLVTQVIAKRIITPLLATPMAGVFKEQLEKREKAQAALHPEKKKDVKAAKAEKEEEVEDEEDVKESAEAQETQETETAQDSKITDEKVFNTFSDLAHKEVKFAK